MKKLQIFIVVFSLLMGISVVVGFLVIAAGQESVSFGIGIMLLGVVASGVGVFITGIKMYSLKEQGKEDRIRKLENEVESLKSKLR